MKINKKKLINICLVAFICVAIIAVGIGGVCYSLN